MSLVERLKEQMRQPDAARAIMFNGQTFTWRDVRRFGEDLEALLTARGIDARQTVGLLSRNRPAHAATILYTIGSGRSISMIYTLQASERIADDLERLQLPVVVGAAEDWSSDAVEAAAKTGSLGLSLPRADQLRVEPVAELASLEPSLLTAKRDGQSLALLSSGTTGAPKRIAFADAVLDRMLETLSVVDADGVVPGPEINFFPLSGMGGMTPLLASICRAGSVCLLEKFQLEGWLRAVEEHQPQVVVVLPAMIREILDKQVPERCLRSVRMAWGGSAPLDPDVQEEFEGRFSIPVLWGYGATEFAGTVASWTPRLRDEFGGRKRGSVGRALPGISIRVVDPNTGWENPCGVEGLLEARVPVLGREWIRTTDLAVKDQDDFIFLRGRSDQAIIRGGFKVLPETISDALRDHPAVRDAMAAGVADRRLGQVPIAAVELRDGAGAQEADLIAFLRSKLMTYAVPTRVLVVPALPRTGNLKSSIAALREMAAASGDWPP